LNQPAVVVEDLWKKFRRGERLDALRDAIPALGRRLLRGAHPADHLGAEEFWALRDVTFAVEPGEALGVIGPNGAGKSTLLKLLTRILRPTRGTCVVRGRTGALIEVAAGFHPDLTGRENVFLQGAIMGMARHEIAAKLDAIVDFAGTGAFLETPIKRYSSGMNARLGFAIAAHLDPDVLLIDEALAVGDLAFQERCYQRMNLFKRDGVAIVFVSHNLSAVATLCDRVAVFVDGSIRTIDRPDRAFEAYAAQIAHRSETGPGGSGTLTITNEAGEPVTSVNAGDEIIVRASMYVPATAGTVSSGIRIRRVETGEVAYLTTSPSVGCAPVVVGQAGPLDVEWRIKANLSRGHYYIEVVVFETAQRQVLMSITAPQIAINEHESEVGSTYVAARCAVEYEAVHDAAPLTRGATPLVAVNP